LAFGRTAGHLQNSRPTCIARPWLSFAAYDFGMPAGEFGLVELAARLADLIAICAASRRAPRDCEQQLQQIFL